MKFKALKKRFGFDIAVDQKEDGSYKFLSDDEKYNSLLLKEFADSFVDAVNNFIENAPEIGDVGGLLISTGTLSGRILYRTEKELKDPDFIRDCFIKEFLDNSYNINDKENE